MNKKDIKLTDYSLERNTLKRIINSNNRDKIELEIGDSKQDNFFPQFKLMRWDNEVNFSIRYDNNSRNFIENEGKIICEGKEDVVMYELDDGVEFEIILKEKPVSNVFNYSIETKDLEFIYQYPLTEEEKEKGFFMEDFFIGSYVVYHKYKRDNNLKDKHNYKTGKFMNIYRPKAIDNNGDEVWCELNVDVKNKNLKVTVPQSFLNNAKYPIIVDPTFGFSGTPTGLIFTTSTNHLIGMSSGAISQDGVVVSLSLYLRNTNSSRYFKGVILNSSYNILTNGVSPAKLITSASWHTIDYVNKPSVSDGNDYFACAVFSGTGNAVYYESRNSSYKSFTVTNNYTTPTDLASAPTTDTWRNCLYATYEDDVSDTSKMLLVF